MKIIEKLKTTEKTLFSFELLPPLKGRSLEEIFRTIDPLVEFDPLNINVTYHQQESVYHVRPDGLVERRIVRKRPGTVAISSAIQHKYNITVVPHVICGGFTREETEDLLIDLHFLGMNNLLVLRGDPPAGIRNFIPVQGGHAHTNELVEQIINLNKGIYLDPDLKDTQPTDFSVGVAGYPEKHFESPNLSEDLHWLKKKVQAGADYIVTQMFFNNEAFFRFVKLCREEGIEVPVIPGIKPINTLKDIEMLPRVFHIDIPQDLVSEIRKCRSNEEAREAGIEWTVHQSKQLQASGVPAIHYYTIGISDNIRKIAARVF
ncbi:MAG: methylenetetrahydrofolate reductase [Bacteroidales bacterium]|nr:methylenetetrahydrofolate reductase [Bacteroidales bacterium]MBN2698489.1 methylenetetrahydrofolate reductase [Bacteroidales bacterium]